VEEVTEEDMEYMEEEEVIMDGIKYAQQFKYRKMFYKQILILPEI